MRTGATWWRCLRVGIAFAGACSVPGVAVAQSASFPDVETPPPGAATPPPSPPPLPPPAPPPPPTAAQPAPAPPPTGLADPGYDTPPSPSVGQWTAPPPSAGQWTASAPSLYPPVLPYRKGLPVPPGYVVERRPATGLIVGGLVTLLAAYSAGIVIAAGEDFENGTGWLALPLLGPWGAIGARTFSCRVPLEQSRKCVNEAFDEVELLVFMTADGMIQGAGAALFFVGLASGHEELVRQDLKKVSVGPRRMGRDGWGLGVSGVF